MTVAVKNLVTAYAETDGQKAGPYVRAECNRYLKDLERQGTPEFPYVFSESKAEDFFTFARNVYIAADVPFKLAPFQEFIVGSVFGWVDEKGLRRFRTAYIEIGKGNGKTPLAALVGLYGLTWDKEWQAEVYSAAVTRDQANITFRDAKNMAESSPMLASRLDILEHNIGFRQSFFRTVSSEGRSLDGKRPHISLIDEVHEHPNDTVVQKQRAGMKRRLQPIVWESTNSGSDRNSICYAHHQHSVAVAEGLVEDETWFSYVCALDPQDDWRDESVWLKTNPGLGTILPKQYLVEQVKEATNLPSSENLVKRLNFCVWTEQSKRWLPMEAWDSCVGEVDIPEGETCYIGLDLASKTDFTAAAFWFPRIQTVRMMFWVPQEMESRTEQQRQMLRVWERQGFVRFTEGNVCDYDEVREDILDLASQYQVEEIDYDKWNATQLSTQFSNLGLKCIEMQQGGAVMSDAAKELEKMVVAGTLKHGGNPVLRWMASNLAVKENQEGNLKLDRDKSGDKIDGVVALVMAIGRGMMYEDSGGWFVR